MEKNKKIGIVIDAEVENSAKAQELKEKFEKDFPDGSLYLKYTVDGLCLCDSDNDLRADFTKLIPRIKGGNLQKELLVHAAKIKKEDDGLVAIDATAGFGEDSFFLAAAGFKVYLFERNPVIFELLSDALERAKQVSGLDTVVSRMMLVEGDSVEGMRKLELLPDVVLLDPMFPERQKSSLVKKKLQMIQKLEAPCDDERALFFAAVRIAPKKLIIKRPPKGAFLAGIKPDHSVSGKAVRFDCFVDPFNRINKFEKNL